MRETFSQPEPEIPDGERRIREAWSRADRFLSERRPEILERVRSDAELFFGSKENAPYGLRTLAAAIELDIVSSPPDAETAENVAKALHHTDAVITEAFDSDEARKLLTGLGLYEDRLTVDRWIGKEKHRQPLLSGKIRERIVSATERHLFGSESRHAEGMRHAAVLFRAGLFPDVPETDKEAFFGRIDDYLPDAVDRGSDMLDRELATGRGKGDPDRAAPNAAYGLFVLSDARILTENRNAPNT